MAVIEHIVEQHAEELAFQWLIRDEAVDAPHYTREHLGRLDERIEAHLDGLRVAGDDGWRIALAALEAHPEPGEVFAAGALALGRREAARIETVLKLVEERPETVRAFVSALGWVPPARLNGLISPLIHHRRALRRYLGVAACSVHRVDPGARIADFLADEPMVRARALRLAGELGRVDLVPTLRAALRDADRACRFWAAWSAALVGEREGVVGILRDHAEGFG
ncbi:MAG TPA: HEAT repeat domain-containing protein, partial [Thermohalobaculum sp.]|nr:HEAT repeat domain-containing protein [Thermohalobaculum sp.]